MNGPLYDNSEVKQATSRFHIEIYIQHAGMIFFNLNYNYWTIIYLVLFSIQLISVIIHITVCDASIKSCITVSFTNSEARHLQMSNGLLLAHRLCLAGPEVELSHENDGRGDLTATVKGHPHSTGQLTSTCELLLSASLNFP